MAGEWETRRIGDLGRVVTGKTPSTAVPQNFGGEYPFITIPDMVGRREISTSARSLSEQGAQSLRTCRLPVGAVMMSCIATIGNCGITTRPSFTNQQINSLICGEDVDPRFVYYCFTQLGHALEAAGGGGSVYTNVSKSRFEQIEISLPPFATQKAIASVLGTLDDLIELNRQTNEILEEMALALFKSWFVDFDPVCAKLEGRPPAGMDAATAALFPDHFQDSELGQIPKGWEAIPLYDTAKYINGAAFNSDDFSAPGVGLPVIKIAELKQGVTDQTKWSERESGDNQVIDTGDLVYSWSGSPDTSLDAFLWCHGRGLLNQHIFKVVAPPVAQKHFVYYLLQYLRPVLVDTAKNKQTTGLGHVTVADMKRILVCWPGEEVLEAFDRIIGPIFDSAFEATLESRDLATMRDTLLPKLLSGELSVAEMAKEVSA